MKAKQQAPAAILCTLCPNHCNLLPGQTGACRVRTAIGGEVRSTTYGAPCSLHIDPIEKKPLYHFLPATPILSVATPGCNLRCKQCQNALISQAGSSPLSTGTLLPEALVNTATQWECPAIAYTYTEPLVSYEYTFDCCKAAHAQNIKNVLVTAAYLNPAPLTTLCQWVDAANVDLKAFSDTFYRQICGATLAPILEALCIMNQCNVMLELTNLIIPTLNDDPREIKQLCEWVVHHLGPETPLHFSRFFPHHQLQHLPPTPPETLLAARQTALDAGLQFVYVGNISDKEGENTYCPTCSRLLIERHGYTMAQNQILRGHCPHCATPIHGVWN